MKKRIGILLSGRGSNFEAIARNVAAGMIDAGIAVVISNRPEAPGLETARRLGLTAVSLPSKGLDREVYDRMVVAELKKHQVDLVCLAGYMRLLSAYFVREFPLRILNIHPALLPSFPGLDAQHQAIDHGVKVSGCTVHFVDENLDSGPILVQAVVPVCERRHRRNALGAHSRTGAPDLHRSHQHRPVGQLPHRRAASGVGVSQNPIASVSQAARAAPASGPRMGTQA